MNVKRHHVFSKKKVINNNFQNMGYEGAYELFGYF